MKNNQNIMQNFLHSHISHKSLRFVTALCAAAVLAGGTVSAAELNETAPAETGVTFTETVMISYDEAELPSEDQVRIDTLINKNDVSFLMIAERANNEENHCQIPSGWPVESRLVSTEFNPTANPSVGDGRKHEGMDISTQSQIIPIYATAGGKVITANFDSGYGNQVIIDHGNGYTTLYAHCNELLVSAGETVKKGDAIATTGNTGWSTGIHLHYEVMLNGEYQNPRDFL